MTNLLDYNRVSDYISAIANRELVAISSSISSSTGYLRGLVIQSQGHATQASGYAGNALEASESASLSATTSLTALNDFTSTYLGVSSSEPQLSSQGNPVKPGAIYIRSTDGRLRYATTVSVGGVPTYNDATVTADPASLVSAGNGVFLSLLTTSQQIVKSPVTFQGPLLGQRITSWTTQQLATAIDVNDRLITVQGTVTAETNRATVAEAALNSGKVSKTGDTMSATLQILATGDNASLTLRNTTSGSGRIIRLNTQDNGTFRICDDTNSVDRLLIKPSGEVSIVQSLTVGTNATSKNFIVNQSDTSDAGYAIHRSDVPRWYMRRSESAQRFYISRMNNSGAYLDTPLFINESDGSVVLQRTSVTDTLSAVGSVTVSGVGASTVINNTSSSADSLVQFRHNNVNRWVMGRSPTASIFYINRFNGSGGYVDTPFQINESTGLITVGGLTSVATITAVTALSAPIVYATANGTGRNIAVGDDVWIGDQNISNTMTVRGQADFNAGFISFGNSGIGLGCNSGDGTLRYNGQPVYHAGNFSANNLGYQYGSTGGVDWTIQPAGNGKRKVTFSGSVLFTNESTIVTVNYPFAVEQIMAFSATSFYNTGAVGNNHDTFSAFAQPPGLNSVKVFVNKTSGDSVLPVTLRWVVEAILT